MNRRRGDDPDTFDGRPQRDGNGRPWWTLGWRAVLTLGPVALIALALVGAVLGLVPSPLSKLDAHVQEQGESIRLLRLICVSLAKTDEGRERCTGEWRRPFREDGGPRWGS
jgi:hypothetical protein